MRNRAGLWYLAIVSFAICWNECVSFSTLRQSVISSNVHRGFQDKSLSEMPVVSIRRGVQLTRRNMLEVSDVTSLSIVTSLELPTSFETLVSSLFASTVPLYQAFALNSILFYALRKKLLSSMLTPEGLAHSLALGTMLWSTLGWKGWTLCVLYLFLGSAVTKVKMSEKQAKGIAEGRGGRRGPENVWGSAATALLCAAASVQDSSVVFGISSSVFQLAYVASLATKLADTFASEIGKAYGKTTFLITTLERVEPGTEGAVSLEGTLAAILGGALLSFYGYAVGLIPSIPATFLSIFAAFLATNAESVIGATLQGKKGLDWMTNEVVNFLNTLIGAAIAIIGGTFLL